jgi:hypothetical protein
MAVAIYLNIGVCVSMCLCAKMRMCIVYTKKENVMFFKSIQNMNHHFLKFLPSGSSEVNIKLFIVLDISKINNFKHNLYPP